MSERTPDLEQLCACLQAEGHLGDDWPERLEAAERQTRAPWYVRAMVGFGAWLASLLLIGFIVGISTLTSDSAFVVTGAVLVLSAVALRRSVSNDFTDQVALAVSLAGQGLLVFGVVELVDGAEPALLLVMGVNTLLIGLFPDGVQRVFSVVAITGAAVGLLYLEKTQGLLPILAPALTLPLVLILGHEGRWQGNRHAALLRAMVHGLLLAAFGCVLLSALYVLPDLAEFLTFYPRPWISTLGFGALLLGTVQHYLGPVFRPVSPFAMPAFHGFILALTAASLWAPGISFSLLVCLLGAARDDRTLTGAGLGFFALFLTAFFYGVETSLLAKSATLVATGLVVLIARFALLRALPSPLPSPERAEEV